MGSPQEPAGGPRVARVPLGASRVELREKGSRFLALVEPVRDEAAAKARLEALAAEHRDATHVCWALRLLDPPVERCSDAGEPSGTAGPPILRVLAGAGLRDALGVVVRWFGGTKLGKGGLARAYAAAVRAAIAGLEVEERRPSARLEVKVGYEGVGAVQRLVQPPSVVLEAAEFGEGARFVLAVWRDRLERVREALAGAGARSRLL